MRRVLREQRGQATVLVACSMTAMLLIVGLAADAGQLFSARRTMQEAADAGAYAGAVAIYQGGTSAQAIDEARADVARNGFTDGANGGAVSVTVRVPATGAFAGKADYVEVLISEQIRTAILSSFARPLTTVSVRAVAGSEPLNNGYAVIALERGDVQSALRVGNSGSIGVTGAGILVNSTNSQAAYNQDSQGTNVNIDPAYRLDVAGGAIGGWNGQAYGGAQQQANPFAGYPKPSTAGLPTYSAMPADGADGATDNVITIHPGIYTTEITAAGTKYVKMTSGTYILKAGMNATGNATICSTVTVDPAGTPQCSTTNGGVFIFNTTSDYPDGSSGPCGNINLNGNGRSVLYPTTSGTYAGMLVYQDESCSGAMSISGSGELQASGTIYLPNAPFVMNGNNATLTGSQVVANTVDVQQGNLSLTFDGGLTAQPNLPRLAE